MEKAGGSSQSGRDFQLRIYFPIENQVDHVHDAWTRWRDSSPSWTEVARTRGPGSALPTHER
jgi:hypothetical protein